MQDRVFAWMKISIVIRNATPKLKKKLLNPIKNKKLTDNITNEKSINNSQNASNSKSKEKLFNMNSDGNKTHNYLKTDGSVNVLKANLKDKSKGKGKVDYLGRSRELRAIKGGNKKKQLNEYQQTIQSKFNQLK